MKTNKLWHDVPDKSLEEWRAAFHPSKPSGIRIETPCPICGSDGLRRYYQKGHPVDRTIEGIHFTSKGGLWEWCSSCAAYGHYQSLVPDWWDVSLQVDGQKLTVYPDAIEEAMERER